MAGTSLPTSIYVVMLTTTIENTRKATMAVHCKYSTVTTVIMTKTEQGTQHKG